MGDEQNQSQKDSNDSKESLTHSLCLNSNEVQEKCQSSRSSEQNLQNNESHGSDSVSKQMEESKCPVCLNPIKETAYTDSCSHQFCRPCIEEWSQNHNRCPVCRQTYSSIVHSVRSNTDYDRIPVSRPSNASHSGILLVDGELGLLFTPLDSGIYMITSRQTPHGIQYSLLFLAPNQNFILQNMDPNMILVRPEYLDSTLSDLDETGIEQRQYQNEAISLQSHYHNHRHQQQMCDQNNNKNN